jgi:hypothetical protein
MEFKKGFAVAVGVVEVLVVVVFSLDIRSYGKVASLQEVMGHTGLHLAGGLENSFKQPMPQCAAESPHLFNWISGVLSKEWDQG